MRYYPLATYTLSPYYSVAPQTSLGYLLVKKQLYQSRIISLLKLSVLILFITTSSGCASKHISINQIDTIDDLKINRIAILPFSADPRCSDVEHITATEGAEALTRLIEKKLDRFYYLITREKVAALFHEMQPQRAKQVATMLGKTLEVDVVLFGIVSRYQLRKGNNYSVSEPASVAFELYLLDGKKGKALWSASFDKTQKSLSEDLSNIYSFLKEEWRWLTAEELMELGANLIVDKFPGMRQRQQQRKLKPLTSPSMDMG